MFVRFWSLSLTFRRLTFYHQLRWTCQYIGNALALRTPHRTVVKYLQSKRQSQRLEPHDRFGVVTNDQSWLQSPKGDIQSMICVTLPCLDLHLFYFSRTHILALVNIDPFWFQICGLLGWSRGWRPHRCPLVSSFIWNTWFVCEISWCLRLA